MQSLAHEADRRELLRRLEGLRADAAARWGQMDATRMLAHVGDSIAAALGEMPSGSRMGPGFVRHFPVKHLILYVAPFPKGARSPKEFLATQAESFAAARERLMALVERAGTFAGEPGTAHPLLGPLTAREWRRLGWKHLDYHLRQFGS